MCGIAGILSVSDETQQPANGHEAVLHALGHRGPDRNGIFKTKNVVLYHTRLQIIDPTDASNQPFTDEGRNNALVFNGEIFNYRGLAGSLSHRRTNGDVEVLYRLLLNKGAAALPLLNGFFAFAWYDGHETLLLARDRFGVKPLYYYSDQDKFVFASELKALLEITGPQPLNHRQLYSYLRLNYCSGRETIFNNVYRVMPGEFLRVNKRTVSNEQWYTVPQKTGRGENLYDLLDDAVKLRLQADVPLGSFLSGGLDSSVISALAVKHRPGLKTFSIGFKEADKYLDESAFASEVAGHIKSDHHLFRLGEDDFLHHIDDFLNSVDEPFADSSAFNMFMLCKYTRQHVKVALSGDGADELFKGYYKHRAFMMSAQSGSRLVAVSLKALLAGLKSSRSGALANKKRQLNKFAVLSKLPHQERLKFLASVSTHPECAGLLRQGVSSLYFDALFTESSLLPDFSAEDQFDMEHVLPDDMLVKVDRFSMRHGMEVRNPFLDYRVAEYALNLPLKEKISQRNQKIILKKTFNKLLPASILERGKKGFELPLERWLKTALFSRIDNEWLNEKLIEEQGYFSVLQVKALKKQLTEGGQGDTPARMWALIVFQQWLKNYSKYIAPENRHSAVE